jgi:hypothetical protein
MPRPAPVTMATRPSHNPAIALPFVSDSHVIFARSARRPDAFPVDSYA